MAFNQNQVRESEPQWGFACPACGSALIQPLDWATDNCDRVSVTVRCPECFRTAVLHVTQDQANRFLNSLDEAKHNLQQTAEVLDREVFKDTCESFTRALRAGLIDPADF